MRRPYGRIAMDWRPEVSLCLFAAVLAFGTLAWEEALHGLILDPAPVAGGTHLVRDGLLLMPLSLAVAGWGMTSGRLRRLGPPLAAAAAAGAFTALLAPATALHAAVHAADDAAMAHADGRGAGSAMGMAGGDHGLATTLLHGATDALLALPVAFLVSLAALGLLRRRPSRARARRRLLIASTGVMAGVAALVPVSGAVSPAYTKFSQPLTIPPVLTGQNIDISMAATQEQILPGSPTTMWTYNGSFPGPIIRRPTGVATNVRFTNDLPASAGSMTVHHHGAHVTETDDGHPSRYLIAPGASKTYSYPAVEDGAPERAAPQWYHDHRDMVTGRNVWMGLMGAFIYDDAVEGRLNLPKGQYDVPLMVTDREFDANNQISYPSPPNPSGVMGDVILVNGVAQPYYEVGDRRYRFRLYNVSNKREYTFRLGNGQSMTQIGTESGLLPAPVSRTAIKLGPAERADVVIDFAGHLNEDIVLQNDDAAMGPGDRDGEVMQFRVTQDLTDGSSPVPASLRPLPVTGTPVTTRTWNFDRNGAWTINGREFDPDRVDARPTLGTTERWIFRNPSVQTHIVHTHLSDQRLVTRNGQPPSPQERLKESWYLAPGDEVVVDVKFTDHPGKFMLHCHVLEHEDDAMMTQFETVPRRATPSYPEPSKPGATPATPLSFKIKILSSKRLRWLLRRGLRFEAAAPSKGSSLRAVLYARGRSLGVVRRKGLARGRVRVTLKLSRRGKLRLRRLLADRRRAGVLLKVRAGNRSAQARFTVRR